MSSRILHALIVKLQYDICHSFVSAGAIPFLLTPSIRAALTPYANLLLYAFFYSTCCNANRINPLGIQHTFADNSRIYSNSSTFDGNATEYGACGWFRQIDDQHLHLEYLLSLTTVPSH